LVQAKPRPSDASTASGTQKDTVLVVCLARGLGGSTKSVVTVLDRLGRSCRRVLAGPESGPFPTLVVEQGFVDEHLAITHKGRKLLGKISRFVAAFQLARWARSNRHRVMAIHANGPEELNVVALAALVSGAPIVVWTHARDVSPLLTRLGPALGLLLRRVDLRWAAVSDLARRVVVDAGLTRPDEVRIVPNPIDPADIKAESRTNNEVPIVGYLGADAVYKGFELLPDIIEAVAELPVHWMIFSDERSVQTAGTWERLRALPETLVTFAGKQRDVRDAYARCDIVCMPSLEESFGRVAAEAMLNGIPVVASDLEPVREVVGTEAGLLFPSGDAIAAAAAIAALVADPSLRARLGNAGLQRAKRFEPDAVTTALRELYEVKS
jgi:glycosyltransferase involved in cell wall biosynthesis